MTSASASVMAQQDPAIRQQAVVKRGKPAEVWLLTNAPSPYQAELFTAIAGRPDINLSVRLMRPASSAGRAVSSAFGGRVMRAIAPASWRDEFRLHPRALWEAAFGSYDCYVLSGLYTSVTFQCCAAILRLRRKPWIAWLERPRRPSAPADRGRWLSLARIRDAVRQRMIRSATRVLCIGSAARREYHELGKELEKLDVLPYCCDIARYDDVTADEITGFRQAHGLEDSVVFLFSGQLIARKGGDTLLSAFQQIAANVPGAALVILGDGPLRGALESQVAPQFRNRVHFLGHLPQEQLPAAFRAADVFVFASRHDGWGVVINEACAAGLPIVASEQTGAAHDLVESGVNGFRHDAEDVAAFAESMSELAMNPVRRAAMGVQSRRLVERFSVENGAQLFSDAMQAAMPCAAMPRGCQ